MLMIMLMMIKSLKCPTLTKEATCHQYIFPVHHIQRKMSTDIQHIYIHVPVNQTQSCLS